MQALFASVNNPHVDPRLALAFDLGGVQRLGQVLRCKRSNLHLPAIDADNIASLEPYEIGMLRIVESGHKAASPVALVYALRVAIEKALAGYLKDYEDLYRES
jgi:hypothetical protein